MDLKDFIKGFVLCLIVAVSSSCSNSILKRRYMPGFYVSKHQAPKEAVLSADEDAIVKADTLQEIFHEEKNPEKLIAETIVQQKQIEEAKHPRLISKIKKEIDSRKEAKKKQDIKKRNLYDDDDDWDLDYVSLFSLIMAILFYVFFFVSIAYTSILGLVLSGVWWIGAMFVALIGLRRTTDEYYDGRALAYMGIWFLIVGLILALLFLVVFISAGML